MHFHVIRFYILYAIPIEQVTWHGVRGSTCPKMAKKTLQNLTYPKLFDVTVT